MEVRNGHFKDESVPHTMKHKSTLPQDADDSFQRCSLVFAGLLCIQQPWCGLACSHHLSSMANVRKTLDLEKTVFVPESFECFACTVVALCFSFFFLFVVLRQGFTM